MINELTFFLSVFVLIMFFRFVESCCFDVCFVQLYNTVVRRFLVFYKKISKFTASCFLFSCCCCCLFTFNRKTNWYLLKLYSFLLLYFLLVIFVYFVLLEMNVFFLHIYLFIYFLFCYSSTCDVMTMGTKMITLGKHFVFLLFLSIII